MQIAIVDLGIGNLRSVEQALGVVSSGANIIVTSDSEQIINADKMVLPGQGAIGTWFKALREFNLHEAVDFCLKNKPSLGICVGMQALFDYSSEDGGVESLAFLSGKVEHFSAFHEQNTVLKVPHMGWNQVKQQQSHPLWSKITNEARFYFVHSYCANSNDESIIYGSTQYGHEFIACAGQDNVFATQFHPEKSHTDGLQLLKNFVSWDGRI